MKTNKIWPICLALTLFGCATTDPYTGEKKANNKAKAAAIGAVAGAAIGAATGSKNDREKGILTGAAAGAALGLGVGAYMDKQEEELRQELAGTGVSVERNGDRIDLIMPGAIVFETGKSDIKGQFLPVLDSVAKVLRKFDETGILIEGHTDSTGSDAINQALSENRAYSVKSNLIDHDIAGSRISTVGRSSSQPVATNSTAEGRQANRRVELTLIPPQE